MEQGRKQQSLLKFLRLKKLWADEAGASAVEFALIAPVLIFMLVGIVELAMLFFTQHTLESASYNVSRLGKTGFVEQGLTQEQTIRQMLTGQLEPIIDADDLDITSLTYNNFSSVGQPEPFVDANGNGVRDDGENYTDINGNGQYDMDRGAEGFGQAGEVVVYTISLPYTMFTPLMRQFFGDLGTLDLTTRIVVKNEPFDDEA